MGSVSSSPLTVRSGVHGLRTHAGFGLTETISLLTKVCVPHLVSEDVFPDGLQEVLGLSRRRVVSGHADVPHPVSRHRTEQGNLAFHLQKCVHPSAAQQPQDEAGERASRVGRVTRHVGRDGLLHHREGDGAQRIALEYSRCGNART